jgi:predicted nucleic acid-binding Zn ribbon protein
VGDLVGGLLDRLGVSERVERAGVALDWEQLVGPHISRVTVGTRVSGGTLFVEVVSAAWLSELNMMRHELLRRINAGRRRGRIEKIVFVQAGRG